MSEIHLASSAAAYSHIFPKREITESLLRERERRWVEIIEEGTTRLDVCEEGDSLTGFVNYGATRDKDGNTEKTAEVMAIYLDPSWLGRGIGTQLMGRAMEWAVKGGYAEMTLWVLEKNGKGRAFYRKLGFKEDGGIKDRGDGLREVRMRYDLRKWDRR